LKYNTYAVPEKKYCVDIDFIQIETNDSGIGASFSTLLQQKWFLFLEKKMEDG